MLRRFQQSQGLEFGWARPLVEGDKGGSSHNRMEGGTHRQGSSRHNTLDRVHHCGEAEAHEEGMARLAVVEGTVRHAAA